MAIRINLQVFQFTHPGRGATQMLMPEGGFFLFQFTHPGRGATTDTLTIIYTIDVSIHAPREGCD